MPDNQVNIRIQANNQASPAINQVDRDLRKAADSGISFGKLFSATLGSQLVAQWGQRLASELRQIGASFVQAAASAEDLRDALAQTSGAKATAELAELRQAVLTLPVSLDAATGALIKMRTAGIDPSLADLKALADTAGNLRGDASTNLERLAGLLGSIAQRGILGAEDWNRQLMQFKELGLDVLPMLQRELQLTDAQMADLGKSGVSAADLVRAVMDGLRAGAQGGTASWGDMLQEMTNQWNEFQLQVMQSGPFEAMKAGLRSFLDYLNSEKGRMDLSTWARETANAIITGFDLAIQAVYQFGQAVRGVQAIGLSIGWATARNPDTVKTQLDEMLRRKKELDGLVSTRPTDWRSQKTEAGIAAALNGTAIGVDRDTMRAAREELSRLTVQISEAQQYLANPERQPDAFLERLGKLGDEAYQAQERMKGLRESLANIKAQAQGAAASALAAGQNTAGGASGLPRATSIAGDNLDDWLRRQQQELQKELDKTAGKALEEYYQAQNKAAGESLTIRRQLSTEIVRITQGETAAKQLALQQELRDLEHFAAQSKANADQVAAYKLAREAEIARERLRQESALQEQLRELDLKMAQPTAGRFDLRRSQVQTEFLQRSQTLAESRSRGDLTADQESTARGKLNEWRDYEFGRIGLESGNNWAAGWNEGMQQWLDDVKTGFEAAAQIAADTAQAMSQSFGDLFFDVFRGEVDSLSEYLRRFLTSVQRSIANALGEMVTKQLLGTLFGSLTGAGGAGGSSASSLFGGARAGGGPVDPGRFYLVGERGPELLVPRGSGSIVPFGSGAGAGTAAAPQVTVNVINQAGAGVSVRQAGLTWDAETQQMVLTLVADAAARDREGFGTQLRSALGVASA